MNKTTKLICKDPYMVPAICVYLAQQSNTMCSSYGDPGKAGATRDIIVVDEEY